MNVADFIQALRTGGIELWFEGSKLRFRAQKGALTQALREELVSRKPEVLEELRKQAAQTVTTIPLSSGQRSLWFLWFLNREPRVAAAYNVAFVALVTGSIDHRALRDAAQALSDRHAMLRATFPLVDDEPVQRIAGHVPVEFDVRRVPGMGAEALAEEVSAEYRRPFDLERGPIFRVTLFEKAPNEHVLLVTVHHIAADGWSTLQMFDELRATYREESTGTPSALPRPEAEYRDFVTWQEQLVASSEGQRQADYWRQKLRPPRSEVQVPTDHPRPAQRSILGSTFHFVLDERLSARLRGLSRERGATLFVTLLSVFQAVLYRCTGTEDLTIGTPTFGRNKPEFARVIGNFINTVPLRVSANADAPFAQLMDQTRAALLEALAAQDYPFAEIVGAVQPARDPSRSPIFETLFILQRFDQLRELEPVLLPGSQDTVEFGSAQMRYFPLDQQEGQFDLTLQVVDRSGPLSCQLKYNANLYERSRIAELAEAFCKLSEAAVDNPDARLGSLPFPASLACSPQDEGRLVRLLDHLASAHIDVRAEEGKLRVSAPRGALTEELKSEISSVRESLIAHLGIPSDPVAQRALRAEYWRRVLKDAPPALELPLDVPRPSRPRWARGRHESAIPGALLERLNKRASELAVSRSALLLAAWQVLLHKLSNQSDILVSCQPEEGGVAVVRCRFDGSPGFAELVRQVQSSMDEGLRHACTDVAQLAEALGMTRTDTNRSPIFQTAFLERSSRNAARPTQAPSQLDIAVELRTDSDHVSLAYDYASELFSTAAVERLDARLRMLLGEIDADPTHSLRELAILPDDELALLSRWNETDADYDRTLRIEEIVRAAARKWPDATAVMAGQEALTYKALDARSDALAQALRSRGVEPGHRVAVCLERTVHLPVALAGILKAGAAYVPLDPGHPAERLRFTLEDAGASCAVTTTELSALLGSAAPTMVCLDRFPDLEPTAPSDLSLPTSRMTSVPGTTSADLAYLIYTSGSTGRPKGVEIEHRSVVNFLESMRREPGLGSSDVLLAVTTVSFDISGLELWLPVLAGASVVIASRADTLDAKALEGLMERHGVTALQATPATWRLLIESGWSGRPGLKALCGGEALPRDVARALLPRVGELWNLYGPTETTIWSTVSRVKDAEAPITVGRPIANTQLYVVSPDGDRVPVGVTGELCIGGDGLARGYHARPELTAEKFVTLQLPGVDGMRRVYRTGDVARIQASGELDILGRRDTQVKVRGYRIELGEVEAVLASDQGIRACVVIVREDAPGDQQLVAYIVPEHRPAPRESALRAMLRLHLPEYMIPGVFVVLDALPLTLNGKVDRKALPKPELADPTAQTDSLPILMSPSENRVASIWCSLLHRSVVGLHENFFDLGGHSLLLVRLHGALKREFGREFPLVELFQSTTVAQQASRMAAPAAESAALSRARARARMQDAV